MTTAHTTPRHRLAILADPTIAGSVIAPVAAYQLLHLAGWSDIAALSVAAIFPATATIYEATRKRRLNALGALSLVAVLIGLGAALWLRDPRVLLVKDSIVTGIIGLAFLGSLATTQPLAYRLGRQFAGDRVPVIDSPQRLHGYRIVSAVWGVALVGEAALRVALSYVLSTATVVTISPLLSVAVFGAVTVWTVRRARRHAGTGTDSTAVAARVALS
ncbi:VC0807 family protein [Speluncibacter jeojiensis]|uniref:DUF3159 domain-containing protein n=1 Tax=Speluncibacter jeojiensis TaxID=2710754 RepID=A0A9X4M356_9ACTN|nr:hypothetical protein [Corynebacteriales bacterium D3-21]